MNYEINLNLTSCTKNNKQYNGCTCDISVEDDV